MTNCVAVTELTNDTLAEVFNANHGLQAILHMDYYKKQIDYINEIRKLFGKGIIESIVSLYGHNRLVIDTDESDFFVLGAVDAQHKYALLPANDQYLVDDAEERMNRISSASHDEYIQQGEGYSAALDTLAKRIGERFHELLAESQDKNELLEYFISHYVPEVLPNAYIQFDNDGKTDYVLHQRIIATKTYN